MSETTRTLIAGFDADDLKSALSELERLLVAAAELPRELRRLADPPHLDFLFQVQQATLIRQGPACISKPSALLSVAREAAGHGVVLMSTPSTLRRQLDQLEERLRDAGAWDPARSIWWAPLPPRSQLEELWDDFGPEDGCLALPTRADLKAAFDTAEAPDTAADLWLSLPTLLRPVLTRAIWRQLEQSHESGRLHLERGGVGAAGRETTRRSDWVRYVSGLEPELLRAAPALAALVQWGLRYFTRVLKTDGRTIHPPQKAMLARYPAPSEGYAAHMDNPGGEHDNGRSLTLVIYLNAPGDECVGGEIALWGCEQSTTEPPEKVLPPQSGSAALFDSRAIAHQVRPLADGPARWALTFWFNDAPQGPEPFFPRPRLQQTDVLLPIESPPLPANIVLFHELNEKNLRGDIVVHSTRASAEPRIGIVCTVYREGERLDAWCEHHLALGADHLVLIFDHLEEPEEQADADRLRSCHGENQLTIWSGSEVAGRWGLLAGETRLARLPHFAQMGSASFAIASRQTLGASVALKVASTDELGGAPLDWLLHLDADELFHLEGAGRGGATLTEHFAAASASGLERLRYVNHEILLPVDRASEPRFKVNPYLAGARLGVGGWQALVEHLRMAQTDPRPYFNGYFNGKSAVRVGAGAAAAGVHGWFLEDSRDGATTRFLAGPSILHSHFSTAESFRRKYLAIASSPVPEGQVLFELSPSEEATVGLIRQLENEGADEKAIHQRLDELHETMTVFSNRDVELLEEAGLLITGP